MQFLRHDDGRYWTGMNFDDERFDEPGELLHRRAADVEPRRGRARRQRARRRRARPPGLFRGEGLPAGLTAEELIEAGAAIESERAHRRVASATATRPHVDDPGAERLRRTG